MREISNGVMSIKIDYKDNQINVYLSAEQVKEGMLDSINDYLSISSNIFLSGKIEHQEDGTYKITYLNPGNLVSLRNTASKASYFNRLKLALSVLNLVNEPHYRMVMFLNPRNIVVTPNKSLQMVHRGIRELMAPMNYKDDDRLRQIKAMIISIVVKNVEYEDIINDTDLIAKNKFAAKIIGLNSIDDINKYMVKIASEEATHRNSITKVMPKWLYRTLIWGSGILLFLTITIGISWLVASNNMKNQKLELKSTNAYLDGRYLDATNLMNNHNPNRLSVEEQFVLAQSYVHLSNLTNDQKNKFLGQLSPNSDNNLVMYWISDGRKQYDDELNYAKKLNDNELILHAYQQLLVSVKDNGSISGEKKQKLIKDYQDNIKNYENKLNPKKDKDKK